MMSAQLDQLLARLDGVRKTSTGHRAFCPAHQRPPHRPGRGRTLSISSNSAGGVLVHCHAGCTAADIIHAAGLELADLFPSSPAGGAAGGGHAISGVKGWDWWSLASALDATAEALMLPFLRLADAERQGDAAAGRAALVEAVGTLRRLAQQIQYGKGVGK